MPPRLLKPKDEPGLAEGSDAAADGRSGKKRACDGSLPSCSTCTAVYRTECTYDADSDHRRKGALKRDIQSLQQQNDALDVIVASLRSLPETEAIDLLRNLRGDSSADALAESLRTNINLPDSYAPQNLEADLAHHVSRSARSSLPDVSSNASPSEQSRSVSQSLTSIQKASDAPAVWFEVPQDAEFVEHLLSLYFSWVHPFYTLYSREYFLRDMNCGYTDYCSAMLVNATLSYACHYSDRPTARTDVSDPTTAGDAFFAEAKRLLDKDERPCLTTVQALGVMSMRECSHGRESNGYQLAGRCLRMALELGLHLSVIGSGLRASEVEVRRTTFWGIFNMETICSVAFGRLSQLPRAAADIAKPNINDRSETLSWRPYEDTNLALSPSAEQPGRPMLFVDQLSRLSDISSDMINTFYAPQERFTSRRVAQTYQQYESWYRNLPIAFRLENCSLPHVLILHMYYYACILQLFRPYIKLDLRNVGLFPREACTKSANEISGLMNALRVMYGLRRVSHSVCSFLMSASTIHLLNLPSDSAATHLSQGLYDLQAMSINHRFAGRCMDIIRSLAAKWQIELPESAATVPVFRNATSRQWPSAPSPPSTFFAASIPRKMSSETGLRQDGSKAPVHDSPFPPPPSDHQQLYDSTVQMDTTQPESAFWTPFPVQGMPMQNDDNTSMLFDFSRVDSGSHWPMFGDSGESTAGHSLPTQVPGGMSMDETMGDPMGSWQWQ